MSWGLRFWLKVTLGGWALVFFVGVMPVAMLHSWKVGTLPVVEGRLSNHHIVEVKRKHSVDFVVRATLAFERDLKHCRHDEVGIGSAYTPESFATKVQLAVRTDSCNGYFFLPLKSPNWIGWLGIFLLIALVLTFLVSFLYFSDFSSKTQQKPQSPPGRSASSPE